MEASKNVSCACGFKIRGLPDTAQIANLTILSTFMVQIILFDFPTSQLPIMQKALENIHMYSFHSIGDSKKDLEDLKV